jgi:hypothetical protein
MRRQTQLKSQILNNQMEERLPLSLTLVEKKSLQREAKPHT